LTEPDVISEIEWEKLKCLAEFACIKTSCKGCFRSSCFNDRTNYLSGRFQAEGKAVVLVDRKLGFGELLITVSDNSTEIAVKEKTSSSSIAKAESSNRKAISNTYVTREERRRFAELELALAGSN
jgi:hypothetical protein